MTGTVCVVLLSFLALPLRAEQGMLIAQVKDLHDRPIGGVRLRAGADSSISAPTAAPAQQRAKAQPAQNTRDLTDSYGQARIRLAAQTKAGDVVCQRGGRCRRGPA